MSGLLDWRGLLDSGRGKPEGREEGGKAQVIVFVMCSVEKARQKKANRLGYLSNSSELWGTGLSLLSI